MPPSKNNLFIFPFLLFSIPINMHSINDARRYYKGIDEVIKMNRNKKTAVPTSCGLQRSCPVFETLAIAEDACKDPKNGVAVPSAQSITDAKEWVDENRL
jgi:hypothetical protein